MDRPDGVVGFTPAAELFPFTSRWFDSRVGPVHYVDEGEGRPLLLLHGNPDWAFLYRHVITGLRDHARCIAPDYPGFGLSVHPEGYGHTPGEHAAVIRELVEHLDLTDVIVVGQDWGGPIGMDVASHLPDRVSGLVMGNTWYWPADDPVLRSFSALMGSPPLQWLITHRNLFVDPLMRRTIQVPISALAFAHYLDVVPTPASRTGIAAFPRQITAARDWLAAVEQRAHRELADTPLLLIFGTKDPAFGRRTVVARWQRAFRRAQLVELPDASHYIQEDAPHEIVAAIRSTFGP